MQGRDQDFETFYNNRYAPLEHIFDNHAYCSPVWCWAKQIEDNLFQNLSEKIKESQVPEVVAVPPNLTTLQKNC